MHIGEQERDADGKNQGGGKKVAARQAAAITEKPRQQAQDQQKGGQNAQLRQEVGVDLRTVRDEREHRGGVEGEAVMVLTGLLEIDAQNAEQRPPQKQGGENGGQIGHGEQAQMAEF